MPDAEHLNRTPPTSAQAERSQRAIASPRLAIAAALLLALMLRAFAMPDPWSGLGHDFATHFGAFATGGPASNFAEHGWGASRGMPYDWRVPLAEGGFEHGWYAHHPALWMWISAASLKLFGPHAFALRLPALIASLFACVAVFLLARRLFSERVALIALALMAVIPFSVRFGTQAWTEAALVGTGSMLLFELDRWLDERRRGALLRALGWTALGGLLDWPAHFWLPPIAVLLLVRARREGGLGALRAAWCLPLVALATIALHWLHMRWALSDAGAQADSSHTLASVMRLPGPLPDFLRLQWGYLVEYATWPVLVLCAFGLFQFGRTQRTKSPRAFGILLCAAVPGLLYVGLFPGRSVNHYFFPMLSLPFLSIGAALGVVRLESAVRRWASAGAQRMGACAVLLVLGAVLSHASVRDLELWAARRSNRLEELVSAAWLRPLIEDEDALILTHLGLGMALPFESRAQVIHSVDTPADLTARLRLLARTPEATRATFFVDASTIQLLPEGAALLEKLVETGSVSQHTTSAGEFALVSLPTASAARAALAVKAE